MKPMFMPVTFDYVEQVRKQPLTKKTPFALYVEVPQSSHLLVMLGSHEGNFSTPRTAEKLGINCLFLRSNKASWYLEKLPYGSSPPIVANNINKFVATRNHIKTVTCGGFSMGAFAALLYAPWLKAKATIANAPQVSLPINGVFNTPIAEAFEPYVNIVDVWKKHGQPKHKVTIQVCEQMSDEEPWKDREHAERLTQFDCVDIVKYDCTGHKGLTPIFMNNLKSYENTFL